ncbi:MAG: hypothetical protein Q8L64_05730 [bacterium]|nr:hypothetical protein [bacterium]
MLATKENSVKSSVLCTSMVDQMNNMLVHMAVMFIDIICTAELLKCRFGFSPENTFKGIRISAIRFYNYRNE